MLSVGITPSGLLIWEQSRRLLLTLPPSWRSTHVTHERTRRGKEGLVELLFSRGNEVMSLLVGITGSATSLEKVTLLRKEKQLTKRLEGTLNVCVLSSLPAVQAGCSFICELVVDNFITLSLCLFTGGWQRRPPGLIYQGYTCRSRTWGCEIPGEWGKSGP